MSARINDASFLANWRKSTYSENGAGGCIEVSDGHTATVPVRDSKAPTGPAIVFTAREWSTFVSAVKANEITS
ncbi:DUF397 domain-containing protein [Streptomyces spiramenti]|uniref:DUF397 domain-containing protein n=1 Tax=Streptomyces spiramenti TaxID=2720606 RepID=A0ABX1AJZ6_9ACTN|nr:DUF397 domain-containing protein [Streptomyces spiramenti]NJP65415.1 DUF397 domain-containing protein [Streptomyces spiramenti]